MNLNGLRGEPITSEITSLLMNALQKTSQLFPDFGEEYHERKLEGGLDVSISEDREHKCSASGDSNPAHSWGRIFHEGNSEVSVL